MIIASIDGGAERLGWSILERAGSTPIYLQSGLVEFPKDNFNGSFQDYRLALINHYAFYLTRPGSIFDPISYDLDEVVTETLPPMGFNSGVQAYLVNVALTTVQCLAMLAGIPVTQISARTVQSKIAVGRKGKKISKVQVRNGVFQLLPELLPRKGEWTKVFDEPDAIAVGLTRLGFQNAN